jgi:hypothetical protein
MLYLSKQTGIAIMSIKVIWQKFKKFYNASEENKIGVFNFLAFLLIPAVGLMILYIIARTFWM